MEKEGSLPLFFRAGQRSYAELLRGRRERLGTKLGGGGGGGMDIGIKLLPVMWVFLCIPRYIHCL